jgi:phosphate:Na+ symporter
VANILKHHLRLEDAGFELPEDERDSILDLHDRLASYTGLINTGYSEHYTDVISKADSRGTAIRDHIRALRSRHLAKLSDTRVEPMVSTAYTDMLNAYHRVEDHLFNIAQALAGQK